MKAIEFQEKLRVYKFRDALGHALEYCVDYQNLIAECEKLENRFEWLWPVVQNIVTKIQTPGAQTTGATLDQDDEDFIELCEICLIIEKELE